MINNYILANAEIPDSKESPLTLTSLNDLIYKNGENVHGFVCRRKWAHLKMLCQLEKTVCSTFGSWQTLDCQMRWRSHMVKHPKSCVIGDITQESTRWRHFPIGKWKRFQPITFWVTGNFYPSSPRLPCSFPMANTFSSALHWFLKFLWQLSLYK